MTIQNIAIEKINDRREYISGVILSSVLDSAEDYSVFLWRLWDAAHRSIKDIAREVGLSNRQLATRYAIPIRTLEGWSTGTRTPPLWTLLLLQEAMGLLKVSRE